MAAKSPHSLSPLWKSLSAKSTATRHDMWRWRYLKPPYLLVNQHASTAGKEQSRPAVCGVGEMSTRCSSPFSIIQLPIQKANLTLLKSQHENSGGNGYATCLFNDITYFTEMCLSTSLFHYQ